MSLELWALLLAGVMLSAVGGWLAGRREQRL